MASSVMVSIIIIIVLILHICCLQSATAMGLEWPATTRRESVTVTTMV